MNWHLGLFFVCALLHCSYAPPVTKDKKDEQDSEIKDDLDDYMEYSRYLKEVVQTLESDPDFRERLEKADEEDVRSGKIAEHLDFVNHNVRTKLDEIKRRELERLRHLATKQYELTNDLDTDAGPVATNEHLDHANPHTFEIEDLKKLIRKTTSDLEMADKKRKDEFKEYEMQKEFEKHQKMEKMDDKEKKDFETQLKNEENAKKEHKPVHHPGSKQQLEEVWEKQDHMDQQFDPKAFFMLHDVDGNGVWDADEVKALFIKELDKLYGPGGPNKDLYERAEEMERMREHVFKENDLNRDGLIDFQEFMQETQKAEFQKDEGWKSIDENQIYTQAEYSEFERRRLEEMKYLQQRGLLDAYGRPVPGAEHQLHQYYNQQQALHQAQQAHGGQYPPYQQQAQYQQHPNQFQPQQGQIQQPNAQFQPPNPQFQQQQGQFQQQQGQFQQHQGQFQQPQGQIQQPQGQFQPPQGQFQQPQVQVQQPQVQGQAPQAQGQFQQPQAQQQQNQQAQQQQNQQAQYQQKVEENHALPQVPQVQAQDPSNHNQAQASQNQAAPAAHVDKH